MFLAELETGEREAFLELASFIAIIDGNLSIYESSILEKYKQELGLENYCVKGLPLKTILGQFKDERSKHIVLTEILQLIYADGVYHSKEKESVRQIKDYFGFNQDEYGNMKDWISKIKELSNTKKQ